MRSLEMSFLVVIASGFGLGCSMDVIDERLNAETAGERQADGVDPELARTALLNSQYVSNIPRRGGPFFIDVTAQNGEHVEMYLGFDRPSAGRQIGIFRYTREGKLQVKEREGDVQHWKAIE
jgi:hypothetical protein